MARKSNIRKAGWPAWVFLIGVALAFISGTSIRNDKSYDHAVKTLTAHAQGTVTNEQWSYDLQRTSRHHFLRHRVQQDVIVFSDARGVTHSFLGPKFRTNESHLGRKVQVSYDPQNPYHAQTNVGGPVNRSAYVQGWRGVGIGAAMIVIGLIGGVTRGFTRRSHGTKNRRGSQPGSDLRYGFAPPNSASH